MAPAVYPEPPEAAVPSGLAALEKAVGDQIVLIAVGGVQTANDVQERLDAGATLVQGYTAFLYEGPFWAARINRDLAKLRKRASH